MCARQRSDLIKCQLIIRISPNRQIVSSISMNKRESGNVGRGNLGFPMYRTRVRMQKRKLGAHRNFHYAPHSLKLIVFEQNVNNVKEIGKTSPPKDNLPQYSNYRSGALMVSRVALRQRQA